MADLDSSTALLAAAPTPPAFGAPRGIPMGGGTNPTEAARKTGQDFEAFFVTSMLESMMSGLKTDKMFGGGQGETLYRSMLNQYYGKAIAARGTLGIGSMVTHEILRMQESANK
jgi:Rod binding domain-containing protein